MELTDLHCHIVPYVDDGAQVLEEAMRLIQMQYRQGARVICATPHLRKGMFETPDEDIKRQFTRLREIAENRFPDLMLYLSREYHCDALLRQHLKEDAILPLGEGRHLLIEFSYRHSLEEMFYYIDLVLDAGYLPLIAHVERYPAAARKESIEQLIHRGAEIQVNAGSVVGDEGLRKSWFVRGLLKDDLVHVVASDAHDSENRPPKLDRAYQVITKKCGEKTARQVMLVNPLRIVST